MLCMQLNQDCLLGNAYAKGSLESNIYLVQEVMHQEDNIQVSYNNKNNSTRHTK